MKESRQSSTINSEDGSVSLNAPKKRGNMALSMRILGIDPGSRLLGYGCVEVVARRMRHITSGTLEVCRPDTEPGERHGPRQPDLPLELRLLKIHHGLSEIITRFQPSVLAVEKVFFAKNALSALKLGQARGAVLLTGAIHGLTLFEYSPNEVKRAVVGQGHAEKQQVARMVELILGVRDFKSHDASDGLALAICHAQTFLLSSNPSIPSQKDFREKTEAKRRSKKLTLAEAVGFSENNQRRR